MSTNALSDISSYVPFAAEAEKLIHGTKRYQSNNTTSDILTTLSLAFPEYPVIPVEGECYLLAKCGENYSRVVWLADWFEIVLVSSFKGRLTVTLMVNDEDIKVGYGAFVPKLIPDLAEFGIVADYNYASELSKYVYKKLPNFDVIKEDSRIGFIYENSSTKFVGYSNDKPVLSYTNEPISNYAEGINKLLTNKAVMFALCCGCASLLLAYLSVVCGRSLMSFVISLYGKSTTGKSTAQALIASVYTKPSDNRIYTPFYGTPSGIIKGISNKFGAPQIFDEATVARNLNMGDLIYTISLEHDKQRCNSNAELKKSDTWKTVVITSSENKLLSETQVSNKGLEPRCLSFGGLQYTDSREHSEQIHDFCRKHYGVIGKAISEHLLSAEPAEIEKQYDSCRDRLRTMIGNDSFDLTERLINEYALILQSALILKTFGVAIDETAVAEILTDNHSEIALNCNIADRYYSYLMAYVAANPFSTALKVDQSNGTVAIIYTMFDSLLQKHGATNIKLVVDELIDSGYLIRGSKRTPKRRLRFNGNLADCYILTLPKQNGRVVNGGITLGFILENYEGLDET